MPPFAFLLANQQVCETNASTAYRWKVQRATRSFLLPSVQWTLVTSSSLSHFFSFISTVPNNKGTFKVDLHGRSHCVCSRRWYHISCCRSFVYFHVTTGRIIISREARWSQAIKRDPHLYLSPFSLFLIAFQHKPCISPSQVEPGYQARLSFICTWSITHPVVTMLERNISVHRSLHGRHSTSHHLVKSCKQVVSPLRHSNRTSTFHRGVGANTQQGRQLFKAANCRFPTSEKSLVCKREPRRALSYLFSYQTCRLSHPCY